MHSNLSLFIKKNKNRIWALGLTIPIIGSAAGCGASSAELPQESPEKILSSEEVKLSYEAPTQIPRILIDQVGYDIDSEKAVVFSEEGLSGNFYVCELETGIPVYTGTILKGQGHFTDLKEEGSYYIYTDEVGESYSFSIKEDIYGEVFNRACKKYYINRCGLALSENYAGENAHSACHTTMAKLQEDPDTQIDVSGGWHMDEQARRDTKLGSRIAENLLLAYEMNPDPFSDESGIPESGNGIPDILDEVRYEVEWLLKMQDAKTGGEYGAAVTDSTNGADLFAAPVFVTPTDLEATVSFAAAAARFSYIYQQYDAEFATTCLKAADRAWTCYLNNQKPIENTASFEAAAQLYRATGAENYHQVLEQFFEKSDFDSLFDTDENIFMGGVTYLSINKAVDVERCTALMKLLMKRSEQIASDASKSPYLVTDAESSGRFDRMLDDMRCLTITDHIIYNHEYTTIIENHAHFLMGMNPDAINFISDDTERTYETAGTTGVLGDPESDALFIFMLSVII
ncbi:glycoside hydrolase family 9 protein [Butyrivibrio sp. AE2032]|uniref:glycoside hydrolase family 9 protein n=1 Tax=Butyrivibrio sp. AE2032 TaxID=1458463 RepID=UPI00068C1007|nr:glycoside hydrolase family 9 protein [Butyrivibrio sp. AE2032]